MRRYTVNQLAKLSGVSVRTLHHYDEIGLLKPASVGRNGYRYYGQEELLRLQQILFQRELGFSLKEIGRILDRPGFDRIAALREQRKRLVEQSERYRQLVRTIDRTIKALEREGVDDMNAADLYKGFVSEEKQAEYEQWLVARFGDGVRPRIEKSKRKVAKMSDAERKNAMAELAEIEAAVAEACRRGVPADAKSLAPVVARHHAWVSAMWNRPCTPEAYSGLADMYQSHPDFRKRYETLQDGLTDYLAAAMKAWAGAP